MPSRRNRPKRSFESPLPVGADAHTLNDWRTFSTRRHASIRPQSYSSFYSQLIASNAPDWRTISPMPPSLISQISADERRRLKHWRRVWWTSLVVTQLVLMSAVMAGVLTVQSALMGNLRSSYLIWYLVSVGGVVIGGMAIGILWWRRRLMTWMEREWWAREVEKWERKCKELTVEMNKTKELVERLRDGHRRLSRVRSVAESIVSRGRSRSKRQRSLGVELEEEMRRWYGVRGRGGDREKELEKGETAVGTELGLQMTDFTMVEREGPPQHQTDEAKFETTDEGQPIDTPIGVVLPAPKDQTIVIPEQGRPMGSTWQSLQRAKKPQASEWRLPCEKHSVFSELEGDRPGFNSSLDLEAIRSCRDPICKAHAQQLYSQARNTTHPSDDGLADNMIGRGADFREKKSVERKGRLYAGCVDNDRDDHSVNAHQPSEGDGVDIVRKGHGELGSSQSDDNVIAANGLEEDAISYDSAELERRRERSQSRVKPWLEEHVKEQIDKEHGSNTRTEKEMEVLERSRSTGDIWREVKEWRDKKREEYKNQLRVDLETEKPSAPRRRSRSLGALLRLRQRENRGKERRNRK